MAMSDEWGTPRWLMDILVREFGAFDLDPCTTSEMAKAKHYMTKAENGLLQKWWGNVYANPPYSKGLGDWVRKCYREVSMGHADQVVALIPAYTDTNWWHLWVMQATEVRLLRGRLRFDGGESTARFPSVVIVWRKGELGVCEISAWNMRGDAYN